MLPRFYNRCRAVVQLEKYQLLLLFANKHWGPEPRSSCWVLLKLQLLPALFPPPLSEPRRWRGTTRSLQFNMFKIQGSFLCLIPFLINFWVSVFMFSISLSKRDSWAAHLLLQHNRNFLFLQSPEKWWLCNPALSYHWIWFSNILIIRDIEITITSEYSLMQNHKVIPYKYMKCPKHWPLQKIIIKVIEIN